MVLPAFSIYLLVMAFPIVLSIVLSVSNYDGGKMFGGEAWGFAGFKSYARVFSDPLFWNALKNNAYIVLISVFGQLPLGFVVLKSGVERDPNDIVNDLVRMVREQIGAVACFKQAVVVKRLPKTRSGKILRGTMRKIADAETYSVPSTIDDPMVLEEIKDSLGSVGYQKA